MKNLYCPWIHRTQFSDPPIRSLKEANQAAPGCLLDGDFRGRFVTGMGQLKIRKLEVCALEVFLIIKGQDENHM